jgi:hypothetical protein
MEGAEGTKGIKEQKKGMKVRNNQSALKFSGPFPLIITY